MNQQNREVKNSGAVIDCQGRIHIWYNDLKRFFHPNRLTINLVIVHHLVTHCVEVMAYDPDRDLYAKSRLYLDLSSLREWIDQEEVCRRAVEKQKRKQQNQRGSGSGSGGGSDYEEIVEEVEEDMMLTFLLSKVKVTNEEEFAIVIINDNQTTTTTTTTTATSTTTATTAITTTAEEEEGEQPEELAQERQGEGNGIVHGVEGEVTISGSCCQERSNVSLCREKPAGLIPCQVYFAKRYKVSAAEFMSSLHQMSKQIRQLSHVAEVMADQVQNRSALHNPHWQFTPARLRWIRAINRVLALNLVGKFRHYLTMKQQEKEMIRKEKKKNDYCYPEKNGHPRILRRPTSPSPSSSIGNNMTKPPAFPTLTTGHNSGRRPSTASSTSTSTTTTMSSQSIASSSSLSSSSSSAFAHFPVPSSSPPCHSKGSQSPSQRSSSTTSRRVRRDKSLTLDSATTPTTTAIHRFPSLDSSHHHYHHEQRSHVMMTTSPVTLSCRSNDHHLHSPPLPSLRKTSTRSTPTTIGLTIPSLTESFIQSASRSPSPTLRRAYQPDYALNVTRKCDLPLSLRS